MFIYLSVWVLCLGLIIGSFLNYLIWRLYKGLSLWGRSSCPHCQQLIFWYDNIPVLSFFVLGGKCRHCHQKISWQYPVVEAATALLFWLVWQMHLPALSSFSLNSSLLLFRDWLLIVVLIIIFVYDCRWQLVPMTIIWPASIIFFFLNLFLGFQWWSLALYGAIGAAFFFIQYIITAKKGIGEGDIWLGLLLGVFFSQASQLVLLMLLAYCLGSVVGIWLLLQKRKKWKSALPLGPFLALATIITLIFGEKIITLYENIAWFVF